MKLVIFGAAVIATLYLIAFLYRQRRLNLIRTRVGKYTAVLNNKVIFDRNGQPGLSPSKLLNLSQIDGDSLAIKGDLKDNAGC